MFMLIASNFTFESKSLLKIIPQMMLTIEDNFDIFPTEDDILKMWVGFYTTPMHCKVFCFNIFTQVLRFISR